jgi:hypothetical protein
MDISVLDADRPRAPARLPGDERPGLAGAVGDPRQGFEAPGAEVFDRREQLGTETDPAEARVSVALVLAPGVAALPEPIAERVAAHAEEGAGEAHRAAAPKTALRQDAPETPDPGAPEQPVEDRLGLVVQRVGGPHDTGTAPTGGRGEEPVAHAAGGGLGGARGESLGSAENGAQTQLAGQGAHEPRILARGLATQRVVQVPDDHRQPGRASLADQAKQRRRIRAAGDGDQESGLRGESLEGGGDGGRGLHGAILPGGAACGKTVEPGSRKELVRERGLTTIRAWAGNLTISAPEVREEEMA